MDNEIKAKILTVVVNTLHYNEMFPAAHLVSKGEPSAEVIQRAIEGGIDRYNHDPFFAAKCKRLVASILEVLK